MTELDAESTDTAPPGTAGSTLGAELRKWLRETDWRRWLVVLAVGVVWAVWLTDAMAAYQHSLNTPTDVYAYWNAGVHLREGLDLYYPTGESTGGRPYIYPPAFAAVFAPISKMSPGSGLAMWSAIHLIVLYALLKTVARRVQQTGSSAPLAHLLMLLFLSGPLTAEFLEGQVNLLVALLMTLGLFKLIDGKDRTAGALLACAVHVKILPVVLLLGLLAGKKYQAAKSMVIVGLLLMLLPAVIAAPALGFDAISYSVKQHWYWVIDVFVPTLQSGQLYGIDYLASPNLSVKAVLSRWFTEVSPAPALLFELPRWLVSVIGVLITAATAGLALFGTWRDRADRRRLAAWATLLFVAIQLGNLICWQHHLVSVLLIVVFGWFALDAKARRILLLSTLPFLLIFSIPTLVAKVGRFYGSEWLVERYSFLLDWGIPTFSTLVIWAACCALLLRKRSPDVSLQSEPVAG